MAAYPCTDNPNEVIEKILEAEDSAEKFDKFVNGGATEEVQLGTGQPTPTLRNLSHLVKSAAATLDGSDVSGKFSDAANGGTELRMLADRFGDIVNVKDFGAVGDGVTDDTESVQEALDVAASALAPVFFPHGTYKITTVSSTVSMYGEDQYSTTIYGTGSSGTSVIAWSGDNRKVFRGLCVSAADGQRAIAYTGLGRVSMSFFRLLLRGAGEGLRAVPAGQAVSRLLDLNDFSISGVAGKHSYGLNLSGSVDSRIQNCEIMACKIGIAMFGGTNVLLLSDVHIWCGDTSKEHIDWWNGTRCMDVETTSVILATNLYLDTACVGFYIKRPAKICITNIKYADDGYYADGTNSSSLIVQNNDARDKTFVRINGGMIDASRKMKFIYGLHKNVIFNDIFTVVASSDIFSLSNNNIQRTTDTQNTKTILPLTGSGYTPIMYIMGRYGGSSEHYVQDTLNGVVGSITTKADGQISFSGNDKSVLYYKFDSSTYITTVYMHHTEDDTVYLSDITSANTQFRFMHENLYVGDINVPFVPETLDSSSGLTQLVAE